MVISHRTPLIRLTGAAYLGIIICGVFAEGIARGSLIIAGDPIATDAAVRANLGLLRASIFADVGMLLCDVMVAVLFFRLLRDHGPGLARTAMVLRLCQAATILVGLSWLWWMSRSIDTLDATEVQSAFASHGVIYDAGLIFFAANCAAMCLLLWRSGGVPRVIAGGIGVSGGVYLTGSLVHMTAPTWLTYVEPAYVVPLLAESALCLWLLIKARI